MESGHTTADSDGRHSVTFLITCGSVYPCPANLSDRSPLLQVLPFNLTRGYLRMNQRPRDTILTEATIM